MTEPTEEKPAAAPKRDKFASMAAVAAAPAPKRDKFASMAAAAAASPPPQQSNNEAHNESLQRRLRQRDLILADLQKAEGWTWQLVCLARNTARSLSDVSKAENAYNEISQTSQQYRETLEQVHSLLSPHASLVKVYQNHSVDQTKKVEQNETTGDDTKQDSKNDKNTMGLNMYAARVEMRLAKERRDVLQELLRLEQQEQHQVADTSQAETSTSLLGEKRKRKD